MNKEWRYEIGRADLFRCTKAGVDDFLLNDDETIKYNTGLDGHPIMGEDVFVFPTKEEYSKLCMSGKDYFEAMLRCSVQQMNTTFSYQLASYSKRPWWDIYKYMSYSSGVDYNWGMIDRNGIYFDIKKTSGPSPYEINLIGENEFIEKYSRREVAFIFVKDAITNCIRKTREDGDTNRNVYINGFSNGKNEKIIKYSYNTYGKPMDFQTYVTSPKEDDTPAFFCLDVLDNANNRELHNKWREQNLCIDLTSVKREFVSFTEKMGTGRIADSVVNASDEEVIMFGNTCDKIVVIESMDDVPQEYESNVEYRFYLTGLEVIGLYYTLWKERHKNKEFNITIDANRSSEELERISIRSGGLNYVEICIHCERSIYTSILGSEKKDEEAIKQIKDAIIEKVIDICGSEYAVTWRVKKIVESLKSSFLFDREKAIPEYITPFSGSDLFVRFCRELFLT